MLNSFGSPSERLLLLLLLLRLLARAVNSYFGISHSTTDGIAERFGGGRKKTVNREGPKRARARALEQAVCPIYSHALARAYSVCLRVSRRAEKYATTWPTSNAQ